MKTFGEKLRFETKLRPCFVLGEGMPKPATVCRSNFKVGFRALLMNRVDLYMNIYI